MRETCESLRGLLHGVPYLLANLANAAAYIYETIPDLNWAGFYVLEKDTESGERLLALGPFQGKIACTVIPWGKGVCGTAAKEDRTIRVEDVHAFPGHIACDAASASEIVIPIHKPDGSLYGVLDLDSPRKARFTEEDQVLLEKLAGIIEKESVFP